MAKDKYRKVEELYTTGKTVPAGGVTYFLQVLNPFERQEARNDAQTARTLHLMSYQEHGAGDRERMEASFFQEGREQAIEKLIDLQMQHEMVKIIDEVHDDPEWTDRLEVMNRSDELVAREPDDVERQFLEQANRDYVEEVQKRMEAERTSRRTTLERQPDEELKRQYSSSFLERRGDEAAMAEYQLTQLSYAIRDCDATKDEGGSWSHAECSHERVYDKADIKGLPSDLYELLSEAMDNLTLTVREGKGSGSATSSSEPSPLPSEGAESPSSTPEAASETAPGPSTSPSTTPSPSSGSSSSPAMSSPPSGSGSTTKG